MTHRRAAKAKLLIAGLLALVLATTATSALGAPSGQTPPPGHPDPSAGKASYNQNCAACHGATGQGDGPSASGLGVPPAKLGDYATVSGLSLDEMFQVTKNGRMACMMPPWSARLSDAQIRDTVAYAWTLHTSPSEVAMGKAVYTDNCATCHGPDGRGKPPMLDLSDYAATSGATLNGWSQVLNQGRGSMPAFAAKLGAPEQRAVLEYVRSLALGPLSQAATTKGSGVISGTVTNGTTGAPVAGIEVSLGIFDSTTALEQRTGTTDSAGLYRFEGLATDPNLAYVARVQYPAGMPFGSDTASFQAGQEAINLPVSVFETTQDGSGISADRVHFIVDFHDNQANVAEIVVFSHSGNRAYVGDGTGVLHFALPRGAQGLEISDGQLGQRYIAAGDGFIDQLPLPPGKNVRQTLFRYTVPYTGTTADFTWQVPYPAAAVNVLLNDAGEKVVSDKLASQGVRQTQNGSYISLLGQNLPAGEPLTLRLSGLPGGVAAPGATTSSAAQPLLFLVVGLAGAAAAVLVALPLMRRRAAAGSAAAPSTGRRSVDRDGLIDALARLDVAHQSGELGDAAYRDERLRLKAQLLDLTRKEGQG